MKVVFPVISLLLIVSVLFTGGCILEVQLASETITNGSLLSVAITSGPVVSPSASAPLTVSPVSTLTALPATAPLPILSPTPGSGVALSPSPLPSAVSASGLVSCEPLSRASLGPTPAAGSAQITALSLKSGGRADPCQLPSVLDHDRIIVSGTLNGLPGYQLYLLIFPADRKTYFLAYISCNQAVEIAGNAWRTEADLGANGLAYALVLIMVPISSQSDIWLQNYLTRSCTEGSFREFYPDNQGTPPLGRLILPGAADIVELAALTVHTHS